MSAVAQSRTSAVRLPSTAVPSAFGRSIRFGLAAVLAFRVATEAIILLGLHGASAVGTVVSNPAALTGPWLQWDAQWQVAIAQSGFLSWTRISQGPHVFSSAAFQPLLPGLTHVVAAATGTSTLSAALVVVTVALALAAIGLHQLVERDFGSRAARLSVVLLLVFPTAVFLGAPYPEPVVLAEVIWAFLALRSNRPLLAGMLVGLAAMTKLYAVAFALPLAVEALVITAPSLSQRARVLARVAAGPVLGLLGLALFYARVFGDPLRFLGAQQDWAGRHLAPPWVSLANAVHPPPGLSLNDASALADLACVAALLAATVFAWRRLRRSYAVLLAVQLLVCTSTTSLTGTSRWTLDAFPLFIAGGVLAAQRRWLRLSMAAVLLPGAAVFVWIYSHGGWAG